MCNMPAQENHCGNYVPDPVIKQNNIILHLNVTCTWRFGCFDCCQTNQFLNRALRGLRIHTLLLPIFVFQILLDRTALLCILLALFAQTAEPTVALMRQICQQIHNRLLLLPYITNQITKQSGEVLATLGHRACRWTFTRKYKFIVCRTWQTLHLQLHSCPRHANEITAAM